MNRTIFYSWQSDLPNNTNRSFLEQALESATKEIRNDDSIKVQPVLDRDTSGVAGSPEISNTILRKIDASAVFVADVSIIHSGHDSRSAPNPNVLIELGYALRSLGPERVLMVMNSHFGGPEMLPFDLRLRRVLTYEAIPSDTNRADLRREVSKRLEGQLRIILEELDRASASQPQKRLWESVLQAIRSKTTDRTFVAREYLDDFYNRLYTLAPSPPAADDEALVAALNATTPLVVELAQVCNLVAGMDDPSLAETLYAGFGRILASYDRPYGVNGTRQSDFDYFRFMGHELFLTFIAPLVHEKRFAILKSLLSSDIETPVRRARTGRRTAEFHELQEPTWVLRSRSERLNLMSSHATLLHDRHSSGDLAGASPFDQLMGADYFLFLRSEVGTTPDRAVAWFPLTSIYLSQTPTFMERLHRADFASLVANAIGLSGIEAVRTLVDVSSPRIARAFGIDWQGFPEASTPTLIGSR